MWAVSLRQRQLSSPLSMQGLPSLSLSLLLKRERKSLKFTLTFMQEQGLSFVEHTLPYIPFHAGTGLLLYRNYPAPFQAGAPPFRQGQDSKKKDRHLPCLVPLPRVKLCMLRTLFIVGIDRLNQWLPAVLAQSLAIGRHNLANPRSVFSVCFGILVRLSRRHTLSNRPS